MKTPPSKIEILQAQIQSQENFLAKLHSEILEISKKETELTKLVLQKEENIRQKDAEIIGKNSHIQFLKSELTAARQQLEQIEKSLLYRTSKSIHQSYSQLYKHFKQIQQNLFKTFQNFSSNQYNQFKIPSKKLKLLQLEISKWNYQPVISLLLPLDLKNRSQTEIDQLLIQLQTLFTSLQKQIYGKWELVLVLNASCSIQPQQPDTRIKIIYSKNSATNLADLTNNALKITKGAYFAVLTPELELNPYCFFELLKSLQKQRTDLVYFNQIAFDADLLLSANYLGIFTFFRRKKIPKSFQFKNTLNQLSDLTFDLILRITDHHFSVHQIDSLPIQFEIGNQENSIKPVEDALQRRGINAIVKNTDQGIRLHRQIKLNQNQQKPLISIIISFHDQVNQIKACIDSIFEKTLYENYEIILVNNQSELLETIDYMKEVEHCPRVRLFHYQADYNFSAITNFAASQAKGDYLLLLSPDFQIISADWLTSLLEQAQRPEVGAVGITPADEKLANFPHRVNSVSSSCLMINKQIFKQSEGLDEENLAYSLADKDLCLRLKSKGFIHLYNPYVKLHQMSFFSTAQEIFSEEKFLISRHGEV